MIQISAYTTFCQEEGILLQKHRDRNGRCIAIPFKSIGVGDQFDFLSALLSTFFDYFEKEISLNKILRS